MQGSQSKVLITWLLPKQNESAFKILKPSNVNRIVSESKDTTRSSWKEELGWKPILKSTSRGGLAFPDVFKERPAFHYIINSDKSRKSRLIKCEFVQAERERPRKGTGWR